jgi:phage/plasmid-like protein (TIGR03299 family)
MHTILGSRFQNRVRPWDHHSVPVEAQTAQQAFQKSGLDFLVEVVPIHATLPAGTYKGGQVSQDLAIPDRFAVVRPPTSFDDHYQTLGLVGKGYTPLQNTELAQAIDDAGFTDRWKLDAIGYLQDGQKIFMTLSLGEEEIAHDQLLGYFLIATGHDGLTATTIAYTPIRVSCTNALLLGVREAAVSLQVAHGKSIKNDLAFRTQRLGMVEEAHKKMRTVMNSMAKHQVWGAQEILEQAFPDPAPPSRLAVSRPVVISMFDAVGANQVTAWEKAQQTYENAKLRAQELRTTALTLFEKLNDTGHPANARSYWNLYNAITELSNHRSGHQRKDGPDNVSSSVLFGARAAEMGRGYRAIVNRLPEIARGR